MKSFIFSAFLFCLAAFISQAQITERERPAEWEDLVYGGRFMDRFLPMQVQGPLTYATWGAAGVVPRYIENGLEDNEWSYWGGNVRLGEDGKYHLFVCRWREDAEKGHMAWPESEVVYAVAEQSFGPYEVKKTIGPGHNPEWFQLTDGSYVIYVYKGYYLAENLAGPWTYNKFDFESRDREINDGLANLTFARREDGSYLMVCRGGGVWFSQTGISTYSQVTDRSVYPLVEGRFEDPVIWKTNIQYHLIVNDWYGRIAYYLRSKDGVNWKVDPGEAYLPGIAKYEDGTVEDWFKYERIKVLQDKYGRATQAHFAVIDTIKWDDLSKDSHSSKHICIPLTVGRLLTILNNDNIDASTKLIRVKIEAEEGFNPHTDMDLGSLRFGAPEEVNFGRGSKVLKTEKEGDDLIIFFEGAGNGIHDENFTAKLLGKTGDGELLIGYARLPWVDYIEPVLSARLPAITKGNDTYQLKIEVQNFGQVLSEPTPIEIDYVLNGQMVHLASANVPVLKPFQKIILDLPSETILTPGTEYDIRISLEPEGQKSVLLTGLVSLGE
jgi:hypothetical protein